MKIGFGPAAANAGGTYFGRLPELFARYAPQHDCIHAPAHPDELDVYHGMTCYLPSAVRRGRVRSVVTVRDLDFVRRPERYSLFERLFTLPLYRRCCRRAECVITTAETLRRELSERLRIDPERIEAVMPLAATLPSPLPNDAECEAVRRKYGLPDRFLLVVGGAEVRCRLLTLLPVTGACEAPLPLVIRCRRSAFSERVVAYLRERRMLSRVTLLYESSAAELPALMRLSSGMIYLPSAEASVVPIVEAMRVGTPMLLSDTPLNREAAAGAALYADPDDRAALAGALARLRCAEACRELSDCGRRRAERFSERAVVGRLLEIYAGL